VIAGDEVEVRALAGAVRADDGMDIVLPDFEGYLVHGPQFANSLVIPGFEETYHLSLEGSDFSLLPLKLLLRIAQDSAGQNKD